SLVEDRGRLTSTDLWSSPKPPLVAHMGPPSSPKHGTSWPPLPVKSFLQSNGGNEELAEAIMDFLTRIEDWSQRERFWFLYEFLVKNFGYNRTLMTTLSATMQNWRAYVGRPHVVRLINTLLATNHGGVQGLMENLFNGEARLRDWQLSHKCDNLLH
ncbi:MAG: hypothetical protein AB7K41_16600, partial [Bdellovibrionales bacterium]